MAGVAAAVALAVAVSSSRSSSSSGSGSGSGSRSGSRVLEDPVSVQLRIPKIPGSIPQSFDIVGAIVRHGPSDLIQGPQNGVDDEKDIGVVVDAQQGIQEFGLRGCNKEG